MKRKPLSVALLLMLLSSACATPSPRASSEAPPPATLSKKQIVGSILGDPPGIHQELISPAPSSASVPGLGEVVAMLNGALTYLDGENTRHPWLAEAVPTVENGLWTVFGDGRMETTWRIKPGTKWQDGTPLTAEDLRFTLDVYRDRETGVLDLPILRFVEGIEARDPQTAVVKWPQPYIEADTLFGSGVTMWLLPKHILEQPFQESKANFLSLPHWRESFVGAGPFKMQAWTSGSHAVLVANDDYVLGRPRLDQIEVRFFTDKGALKAGLLAGAVNTHIGRGFNSVDVLQIRDASQDVKVKLGGLLGGVLPIYPQSINPVPPILANPRFRRALLMTIDRQEMTDTINNGLGPVAHSWVQADYPEGRAVEGSVVRYQYDPRAATQMIEALGFSKGADGTFQAADGTKLSVQIQTHEQNSYHVPTTLSVVRYWQQIGLDVQTDVVSTTRSLDREWRSLYPSFFLTSMGVLSRPDALFSRRGIPLPENNFVGSNAARYGSAELDGLIDRYTRTIPFRERMAVLGEMVRQQTDQVTMLPLFFQGSAYVLGSPALQNVLAGQVWNAHLWALDQDGRS